MDTYETYMCMYINNAQKAKDIDMIESVPNRYFALKSL